MPNLIPRRFRKQSVSAEEQALVRNESRTPMRTEAAGFGMMLNIHGPMTHPLLSERGAGPGMLGIFSSLASVALYSSGFLGPRAAHALGNAGKAIMAILIGFRLVLIALTADVILETVTALMRKSRVLAPVVAISRVWPPREPVCSVIV